MSLLGKSLESITRADLQGLISNVILESRYIEYKTEVGLTELSDKIKLLAGISSFGNSAGGDLLIGIRAEKGIPLEVVGPNGRQPRCRQAHHRATDSNRPEPAPVCISS